MRALSMGLRESDSGEVKKQFQLCEEVVQGMFLQLQYDILIFVLAAMHHDCGIPFIYPVDLKEVISCMLIIYCLFNLVS